MQTKYIFVTGGVVSGLGKGITVASLGRLLKARGYKVTTQKFDPYINIDSGTMSPYQHGEVFVTEDGAESDLDLGHYERFIDENLNVNSDITTGKIYWTVLNRERKGEFRGTTVQVIPHITNAIKEYIYRAGKATAADIVITEVGGTVGDIEGLPFLEAIRQTTHDVGRENVIFVHVTLVPYLSKSGEMKTKPTQHSVKELLSIGIQPDVIVCRTERPMGRDMLDKLALFCNVDTRCVVQNTDADSIYEVPLQLENEKFADIVCEKLRLNPPEPDLAEWRALVSRRKQITQSVHIALVGKYVELHDAYLSIVEALNHAGVCNDVDVHIKWVQSERLESEDAAIYLREADGIIVPGGFGERGQVGIVHAIQYARTQQVPCFCICMGMQCAVIEFARNVLGCPEASSVELDPASPMPVIDLMPEQYDVQDLGGTMRLGAQPCRLTKDTLAYGAYGTDLIYERHRHRYGVNNEYRDEMVERGLVISGLSPDGRRVEIIELPVTMHPWFVGVQFHPEFKSRLTKPSPLFRDFLRAAMVKRDGK